MLFTLSIAPQRRLRMVAGSGCWQFGTLRLAPDAATHYQWQGVYALTEESISPVWLRVVDGVKLSAQVWVGAFITLLGMSIIVIGWQTTP